MAAWSQVNQLVNLWDANAETREVEIVQETALNC